MSHQTKGLLIALIIIVINIGGYFGKLAFESWFGWISYLVLLVAIIWGCNYYAQQMKGNVSFGDVFTHGFKISVVVTLILLLYTIISVTLLFPEVREKGMEVARQKMEEQNKLTSEQIDQALEMVKKFFWPITIGAILLGNLICGCIASLIGAAVAKKNPVKTSDQFPQ